MNEEDVEKVTPAGPGGDSVGSLGALGGWDCGGARAVPNDLGIHEDGYGPCLGCVVDAGATFVVWD